MGVAVGDYDNDGRADLHITNLMDDYNVLYQATLRDLTFTLTRAPAPASRRSLCVGWRHELPRCRLRRLTGPARGQRPLLYPAADRLFLEHVLRPARAFSVRSGVPPSASSIPPGATARARRKRKRGDARGDRRVHRRRPGSPAAPPAGSATGDLDNDGAVDIVINNLDGVATIARNETGVQQARNQAIGCRSGSPATRQRSA